MSYRLKIEKLDDVLWVTATGSRSLKTVLSMSGEILEACVRLDAKKVLTDVRALKGRLKVLETYELSDQHFPKMRNRSVITHNAIVDAKEFEANYKFFENVAVNRGFNIALFPDPESALKWLKESP